MNLERNVHQPLIVYGHDHCPYACLMAKMLVKYQIDHEWRDVKKGQSDFADELRQLTNGFLSVPTVIFADGTVMVEPGPNQVLNKLDFKPTCWLDRLTQRFQKG